LKDSLLSEDKEENLEKERIPLLAVEKTVGHLWEEHQHKSLYKRMLKMAVATDCLFILARHLDNSKRKKHLIKWKLW